MASSTTTPSSVLDAIAKLDASDQDVVLNHIHKLEKAVSDNGIFVGTTDTTMDEKDIDMDEDADMKQPPSNDEPEFPPLFTAGGEDDFDTAGNCKAEAAELMAAGQWEGALDKLTQAVLAAEPSPLLYANRATVLLHLDRPRAAERDCTAALEINPDSAKALRVRGKARKAMEMWEEALHDLSESQTIDFDEDTVVDLKACADKVHDIALTKAQKRLDEEAKLKKRAEEIKKRKEEAKKEAAASPPAAASAAREADFESGMPGDMPGMPPGGMGMPPGGMPGGMGGIMQALLSDPELASAMQNPKVMAAFQKLMSEPGGAMGLMSNPAKLQEVMSDPEVGPVLQKLITKLGPSMGGGAGGFGGAGGSAPQQRGNEDDIPDLDDLTDPD